ncbi:MAG: sigma factor-like helix-turn-helix DNA-binding protein [Candidatus Bathyarchaeia archaeon]
MMERVKRPGLPESFGNGEKAVEPEEEAIEALKGSFQKFKEKKKEKPQKKHFRNKNLEDKLIEEFQKGNKEAGEELLQAYQGLVEELVEKAVKKGDLNEEEKTELRAELKATFAQLISEYQPQPQRYFSVWLHNYLLKKIESFLEKLKNERLIFEPLPVKTVSFEEGETVSFEEVEKEALKKLFQQETLETALKKLTELTELKKLTETQRRALELRMKGSTYQEIGKEMRISAQRAFRAVDSALGKLKASLLGKKKVREHK